MKQICVPKDMSSGGMDIFCSLLAQVTSREELCALIDASDCFEAGAAASAGVDLSRLLWVRCGKKRKTGPAECGKRPEFPGTVGCRLEFRGTEGRWPEFRAEDRGLEFRGT